MVSLPDILLPKKKYFGLSIERTTLHGIELDNKGKPIRSSSVQMPAETFADGQLVHKDVFAAAVKSLYVSGNYTTPYVAVCFPEVFAFTRGCNLPLIPISEIQEAITWRTKELFPFPQEDIYFDWKILKKTDKEIQTIVVAIQKNLLDQLVSALIEVGLKPLRFEPDASALVRLIHIQSDHHALLVEINPKGAYITLVEGEKAVFTTVINSVNGDTPESYLMNIDQTLVDIATFYKNKNVLQDSTTQIFVTGDMASNEWAVHLGQVLGYPAGILQTPVPTQVLNKSYAAAVQKISPPIDEQSINLLPTETQSFYDQERDMQFYKTMLVRFCIVMGIVSFSMLGTYLFAAMKKQQIDSQVQEIRKLTQSQQADTQALLLLNAQAKSVVALAPQRITPAQKIQVLAQLFSDKVSITQWEYDDSKLAFKITGSAQTREALLEFKQSLDNSKDFINVTLPLESLETPVNVPFMMTFNTK